MTAGSGEGRLKVLHLTHVFPWPPDYGGRIAVWNHLRADARHSRVGLVTFAESEPSADDLAALRRVCEVVEVVVRPRGYDGLPGRVRALFTGHPVNLARYRWPAFTARAREAARAWRPDVVIGQHLHMAPYAPEIPDTARILRPHNVDSMLVARLAATSPHPLARLGFRALAWHTRRDERRYGPRHDRCVFITADDERAFRRHVPLAKTGVLEAGLDLTEYATAMPPEGGPPLLATAGSLGFPPTALGLLEFVERAWPRIRAARPGARFRVIGSCPDSLRARLQAEPGVEALGRVASVPEHLEGVHAFVVALRAGSGVRIKILEAMARRIPVVSTSLGAEGLGAEPGRHYLRADTPEEWVEAVRRILEEPALAPALREAGYALVRERHSLEAMSEASLRLYRETIAGARAGKTARS